MPNWDDVIASIRDKTTVFASMKESRDQLQKLLNEAKTRDDNVKIDEALNLLNKIVDSGAVAEGTAAADEAPEGGAQA